MSTSEFHEDYARRLEATEKYWADHDAYGLITDRITRAVGLTDYYNESDAMQLLGLSEAREALGLLWRYRLLSLEEVSAITDRFVLAAEKAKTHLRKALA